MNYLFTVQFLCHPPLNAHTICRIYKSSVTVKAKNTVSSIEAFFSVFYNKEAVSLNGNISSNAC